MQLQAKLTQKKDCYVSLPRIFQRYSTQSYSSGTLCQVIKAELMKSQQVIYFGCQGISEDNHIEIGFQFASLLQIEDGDFLQVQTVSNCNQSSAITIYVQKWSDYMIVQHLREHFEVSLLNNIQIVYHDIIFPIFYQEGQFVTFTFRAENYSGPIAISPNCELNILIDEAQKPEQQLQFIELTALLTDNQSFDSYIEINTELFHNNRLEKLYQITYSSSHPKNYRNYSQFSKFIKKNKQKQNAAKTAIVKFKQNNKINNQFCFISKFYAKHLGIKEGQMILINTKEHDINQEATIRSIKRNQLLTQKICFIFYSEKINKEELIKQLLEKIEKNQQTVFQSRVHLTQENLYFLRITQIINNQQHFIQTLSITNEQNEPKILGEKEKGLINKYLEEHVKIEPMSLPIQKEVKLHQYQKMKKRKQNDLDFSLLEQLYESQMITIQNLLENQNNSQCLVINKENQANQILIQFLKIKYDVIKLNLDKLNQQGSNEKLQNVKKYIKHIFWQSRQVSLNDILIIIKGIETIKSVDLIDFQQSFLILISNVLSKFLRDQIQKYPQVKLILISPSKDYLNQFLLNSFTKNQIIEFQKPKIDQRQKIFQQYYTSQIIKDNSLILAQKSENFNYSQFQALKNREKLQQELKWPISEDWVQEQIDNLQDQQVQLNKKIPTFKEIGGLKEQKQIILDTFELPMKYEHLFAKTKIKLPKSVLVYGMPGCGKTYFSLSICNELKINVLTVKGPELLDKYIGSSEQNVRDLFQKAQSLAPCIIFLDEIDSVVPVRTSSHSGVTDRVVNQFLCYLDGVEEGMKGVYIVAASSRPDLIDPAILRPGRIDKHVRIDLPNKQEILEILDIYQGPLQFDGISKEEIVDQLDGLSQADVVSFFKEARIYLTDRIVQLDSFSLKKKVEKIEEFKLTKETFKEIVTSMKPSLSQKQIQFYKEVFDRFEKGGVKEMKKQKQALQ